MSTFSNTRRPNVTHYLRDLNALSPQDAENFSVDPDIAMFTNTEFFDFDSGQNTDFQAPPVKVDVDAARSTAPSEDVGSAIDEMPNLDFMTGDFNFSEFTPSAYPTPSMNNFEGAQPYQPLQPNHPAVFNGQPQPQPQHQQIQPHQHAQPAHPQNAARPAEKRKPEEAKRSVNFEEASRLAAEDDKRRRNTAASARFRVKKKQREQALEKSAKEMSEKVSSLESKVSQLETENKWLKNLLVEKNDSTEDISTLWKEFTKHAAERTKSKKNDAKTEVR